jgi:hypothetical protein
MQGFVASFAASVDSEVYEMVFTNDAAVFARAKLLLSAVVLLGLFGIGSQAAAQMTGSILGNVSDPSGAVVINAKVTVQSTQEGLIRMAVSNGSGTYMLPQLPLGSYTVTVEASGFEKFVNTAVRVDADQNVRVEPCCLPERSRTRSR